MNDEQANCENNGDIERLPDAVELLEALGYRFGLDWDGRLDFEDVPRGDVGADLTLLIERLQKPLARYIAARGDRDRRRCNGGPLDGRLMLWGYTPTLVQQPDGAWVSERRALYKAVHLHRAVWAVYRVHEDGRVLYVGQARNRAKALRGEVEARAEG